MPLRATVVDKANALNLPVKADNVHIDHLPEGIRIDVRYFVRVSLPGYTVDLHFYPGRRQPLTELVLMLHETIGRSGSIRTQER